MSCAETLVPCANCPALQRVERELGALRREVSELRCEVGYWKSRHADAVKRNQQLAEELRQAKGEIRTLRDERFGRKSEKTTPTDRSNDLFDPLESSVPSGKRGAQPGQEGHGRRDYSHLPEMEEFISLPTESLACPICGKPAAMMSASEDSELLEIDVRAYRRRIRRRRYRATCDCDPARRTLAGPATAEAHSQRQLWHLDLGACPVGQVFVVSPHGTAARATRTVRFGLAGRHGQRGVATNRADVAADLRGVLPAQSARRFPSGRRNPLAGFRAFSREKGLWLVVMGRSRRGHGDLSAGFQPRPRGAAVAFWPTRLRAYWKSIATRATKPWRR